MRSNFTNSPRFHKGALVVYESQESGPPPKVIVFQYNPESVKRTLEKRVAESQGGSATPSKEDLLRAAGPPTETVNLGILLDATDQLEQPDQNQSAIKNGLYPVLSTLEMLLYPSTSRIHEIDALAEQGQVQVSPADLPLALLVWGQSRVVPVLLTGFSINEENFDVQLNPIRVTIDLTMRVLTYMELKKDTVGYYAYLSYQRRKEQHAETYQPGSEETTIRRLLNVR